MFERFTDRARRAVVYAAAEAHDLKHDGTGTGHLLLGLSDEGEGIPARLLRSLDVAPETVRGLVDELQQAPAESARPGWWRRWRRDTPEATTTSRPDLPFPQGSPPFTPRFKRALERSVWESHELGQHDIGPEHLLLGLLGERKGLAVEVLVRLGVDLDRLRAQVLAVIDHRDRSADCAPPA